MDSSKAHYLGSTLALLLIVSAGRQRAGRQAQRRTDRVRHGQTAKLPSKSDSVNVWRALLEARRPGRRDQDLTEKYAKQRLGSLSAHPRRTSRSDRHLRIIEIYA